MIGKLKRRAVLAASAALLGISTAYAAPNTADNKVKPLDLFVEPPTLSSLGFEWRIEGDDNRNAYVHVQYRKVGEPTLHMGMPLFRLQGERTLENVRFDVISPNMFAGSIIDLQPDTDYEVSLEMFDADGVRGEGLARKNLVVHTRSEPKPVPEDAYSTCIRSGTPER